MSSCAKVESLTQEVMHPTRPVRPRRSALSIPAANLRALSKAFELDADVFIFDLEDSVAEGKKREARDILKRHFETSVSFQGRAERVIRVNGAGSTHFERDLDLVIACRPDAVLLPKVETPETIIETADRLAEHDGLEGIRIWAMIETPKAVLNAGALAAAADMRCSRLEVFVIGLNDLRKETGVLPRPGRVHLLPWMMQILLAARAYGLGVLDSVCNDFSDMEAFAAECDEARAMGFDGKMLIHPSQIEPANRAFGPSPQALEDARRIVEAFADPSAEGRGVLSIDGRMVERLHLEQARHLLHHHEITTRRTNP